MHRLVRISPFDQAARRHTSFASVYVWPELPEDVDIEIDDKDLRIDTYRSSGAGGQHVNVTDSAVRITHLPTNMVVSCQNERSQHRNRDSAMQVLKARLFDLKMKEQQAKLEQISGVKKGIAFGSQIRSYVLHPYQLVKDHRTKDQVGDVNRVLDGDIDGFIKSYLMKKSSGTLGEARLMTMWSDGGRADVRPGRSVNKALLVGAGILMSRLAGLVRLRVFAHYFGLRSDAADAFNAAFRIPNLLQNLFGEGALSGSFIPVYAGLLRTRRSRRGGSRRRRGRRAARAGGLRPGRARCGGDAGPHRGHRTRLHGRQARADRQHRPHSVSRQRVCSSCQPGAWASSTATTSSCCRTPRRSCGTRR